VIGIGLYLFAMAGAFLAALCWLSLGAPLAPFDALMLCLRCAAVGGLGGCLYCLRAMYLNAAVRKQWSRDWYIWYILRPVVSAGSGAVSYLFLKAGLLILESGTKSDASDIGFFALAFIAGLNVDKFMRKVEDVAQSVWGIEKSRTSAGEIKPEHAE